MMINADDPLTLRIRLDMAIWIAVFGTPWMVAARLLWRAWWRRAGAELSRMDGPAWVPAAAAATLPGDRREWGRPWRPSSPRSRTGWRGGGSRPAGPGRRSSRPAATGWRWVSPGRWRPPRRPGPRWWH